MNVSSVLSADSPQNISGVGVGREMDSRQTFMRLLVAQLKNQDPLSPMESTEMVNQLATISNVEHLESIRLLLSSMNQGQQTVNASFASNLLGKTVGLDAGVFSLTGNAADLSVDYRLPESGGPLVLTLVNDLGVKAGESIQKGKAGEIRTSTLSSLFGSSLPKGSYSLVARGENGEVSVPYIQASVHSVVLPEGGVEPQLVLNGSVPVALSQVRSVR
ncbi:flagellar hook capping FlgD N-terminal domain-containing protein [Parendozoicomonas sp. Alg238-R29]|uniref:flagellar hook assembly protein FlgD n=1 Tax=Parendozoicomonas sp. Alg238-R29 TaxID=2993446 RepID=UPI00248DABC8|nr:flagellar hook capping FlgD N-terminal domain-containing protein [Parendozoicomonas sp. Alg238-R29]